MPTFRRGSAGKLVLVGQGSRVKSGGGEIDFRLSSKAVTVFEVTGWF
jgi:hypothetical protein